LLKLDDQYQNFNKSQQEKTGAEMEEVLLQEFKLNNDIPKNNQIQQPQNQQINNKTENNNSFNNSFSNNNVPQQQNFNQNNINTQTNTNLINEKINQHQINNQESAELIKSKIKDSLNTHLKEQEFLESVLESDSQLLKDLVEDVEKMERNINLISNKNKEMKNQILEYRRKINMEKDNLVKASKKLYEQTNETINTKDNF